MPYTAYRYPNEYLILFITIVVLLIIVGITAGATLCLAPLLVGIFLFLAYHSNRSHHENLMRRAIPVSEEQTPGMARLAWECSQRLKIRPEQIRFYVVPSQIRNAYTFGFSDPKVVVIYSALVQTMTPDELRFILGHELGHVALSHTWLNSLLGGMAGIPVTLEAALVLTLAFRWWNRACEYSADRAGLLTCGSLQSATSALIKLVAANARSQAELQRALASIELEDDSPLNVAAEMLSTHPMIIRRIEHLKQFAASPEYQRMRQNLAA